MRQFLLRTVLLLVAAACGGSRSGGGGEGPPPAAAPCRPGATARCLADRAEACRASTDRPLRLAYDTLPPLTVGPGGLVRIDHLGGALLGVDSTRWLACFAECPEGGPRRICFPLALPLRLSWPTSGDCRRRERDAEPWQDLPTRTLELECLDGASSIRFVPGLDRARRDLVAAGAIDGSDLLGKIDGLALEMRAGESLQSKLTAATETGCEPLTPPAGYRVFGEADDFGRLEAAAAEPASALAEEVEKIRAAVAVQAVDRAKAELLPRFRAEHGEECRTRGFDPADEARLEACAAATPATEAPFRAAVSRETARLLADRRAELDALTRRLLVAPICRHYAGSR